MLKIRFGDNAFRQKRMSQFHNHLANKVWRFGKICQIRQTFLSPTFVLYGIHINYCICTYKYSTSELKIISSIPRVGLRNESCFKPLFLFRHFVQPKSKMFGQMSILIGKCLMSNCYFKHCISDALFLYAMEIICQHG